MQIISKLIPVIVAVGLLVAWHAARAETPGPELLGGWGVERSALCPQRTPSLLRVHPTVTAKTNRPPALLTVLKPRGGQTEVIL